MYIRFPPEESVLTLKTDSLGGHKSVLQFIEE
jgi:hypothetical protein